MHAMMAALANACDGADQVEFSGFYTMPENRVENDRVLIHATYAVILAVNKIRFMCVLHCSISSVDFSLTL
jgi:hypothetical protein